jgi:methylmalonyl-CoA mutase N-terminal domain/subunit
VGVNKYQEDEDISGMELLRIDETIQKKQIEKLKKIKAERDNSKVEKSLAELKRAAGTDENIIPHILNCVESYATIGEISNTLRDIWGTY